MLENVQRNSRVRLPVRSIWQVFLGAILCLLASCRLASTAPEPVAPDCNGIDRAIVFAGLDLASAQIHNHIAARILQEGFGCKFTDVPGTLIPLLQELVRGDIDVFMEIWVRTAPEIYREAVSTGDVVDLGLNMTAAVEYSFLVPRYVIEGDAARGIEALAPDLSSVTDLPRYASVFQDPEQPDKGRYHNCVIDWQCKTINTDKLSTYGLNEYFTDFPADTGGALASSLAAAYARGDPWLGYYWGPTWEIGSFDMVVIEEPEYSDDCWNGDHGCAYPTHPVNVAISKGFSELASEAMLDFLRAYEMDQVLVSELLAYSKDNDAEAADVARHFLANEPEVWTMWVSDGVANRIQASLN